MTPEQIAKLREDMQTTLYCFGRIFGASPVDVVCWEDGRLLPTPRQEIFMRHAQRALAGGHAEIWPDFADIYTETSAIAVLAWCLRYGSQGAGS